MNRLSESQSFNRGDDPRDPNCRLKPFQALHLFNGHTFGLIVWESCWEDAEAYCHSHGMTMGGGPIEIIKP